MINFNFAGPPAGSQVTFFAGPKKVTEESTKGTVHNHRYKFACGTLRNVFVRTPEGIVLGKRPAVLLDSKAHDSIVEKAIRGLHFHHSDTILGDRADVKVNWHYYQTDKMYTMSANWLTGNIGKGKLIYRYFLTPEEPLVSVWIFQFFGSAWSSGTSLPKGNRPGAGNRC